MSITSSMNSLASRGYNFVSTVANKVKEYPKTTTAVVGISTLFSSYAYLRYHNAEAIEVFAERVVNTNPPATPININLERLSSFKPLLIEYSIEIVGALAALSGMATRHPTLKIAGLAVIMFSRIEHYT